MKTLIEIITLRWAIWRANQYHKYTKKQYYVLKWYGRIQVFSAGRIRKMRSQRILNKNFNWLKLNEVALYVTPNSLGQKPKLGKPK